MKKTGKRITSVLLSVLMVLSMITTSFADTAGGFESMGAEIAAEAEEIAAAEAEVLDAQQAEAKENAAEKAAEELLGADADIELTPDSDNPPEENVEVAVGGKLVVKITNGSSRSAYTFTVNSDKPSVATVTVDSLEIAAGGTESFEITGVADGTATITIANSNSYGSQYQRKATINLTVGTGEEEGGEGEGDEPVAADIKITPTSSSSPSEDAKVAVGGKLVVEITNGSTREGYTFTVQSEETSVATVSPASIEIAAGGKGRFEITGVADGTSTISISNNSSYGDQYSRKATINLTVGEGGGEEPVPTGETVEITPATDNPSASAKVEIGKTVTVKVTNGSSNSKYTFTIESSETSVATVSPASIEIGAGKTETFEIIGVADGTAIVNIANENSYGSQYQRKATINVTVVNGSEEPVEKTPVDVPAAKTGLVYSGDVQTGVEAGTGYTLSGTFSAANAGDYTASATLADGYKWSDGSTDVKTITWSIARKPIDVPVAKTGLVCNGTEQTGVASGEGYTLGGIYKATNAGTYEATATPDANHIWNDTTTSAKKITWTISSVAVTGISLKPTSLELFVGGKETITATLTPAGASATVNWSSNDPDVAAVSNGVVTAKKAGEATIIASVNGGFMAKCKVTVKAVPVPVTGITLKKETVITEGKTETLTATILPANATNKTVKWSSDNVAIASVTNGVVKANKPGKTTIYANTEDGGYLAYCNVTVVESTVSVGSVTLNKTALTLAVGAAETLTATVLPADAKNKKVKWESLDSKIASVDANGKVTAVKEGTTNIYAIAEDNGITAKCTVTVTKTGSTTGGGSTSGGGSGSAGSSGGSSGGSGGGAASSVKAAAPTYSANWYADAAGTWRIKNSAGQIVTSAWLCDDAVAANGQNVWYLLNTDGTMLAAGLVQDATGHFYSIETNHNGYYGMLRYQDGYYDCNGRQVYLQFSRAHDGSFGAIINAEGLNALREIYGVTQFGINNSNCEYTKTF